MRSAQGLCLKGFPAADLYISGRVFREKSIFQPEQPQTTRLFTHRIIGLGFFHALVAAMLVYLACQPQEHE